MSNLDFKQEIARGSVKMGTEKNYQKNCGRKEGRKEI